jgi:hypothetical protein
MNNHLVDFETIPWTQAGKGIRYKAFVNGNQRLRLAEFSEGFVEEEFCLKGHAGYVLDGECDTDFHGSIEHLKAGDVIFIPKGEDDRHKNILGRGERVLILLFEIIE